jgi:hypothetical protein
MPNEIHLAPREAELLSLENARRFATSAKSAISQENLHAFSKHAPAQARISILTLGGRSSPNTNR